MVNGEWLAKLFTGREEGVRVVGIGCAAIKVVDTPHVIVKVLFVFRVDSLHLTGSIQQGQRIGSVREREEEKRERKGKKRRERNER